MEIGPLRVWLKNEDRPGLAMSRSIGDQMAKTVGVISTPEIFTYELKHKYSVVVIGSDGLFEFLKNSEIADVIQQHDHGNKSYGEFENRISNNENTQFNKPADQVAKELVGLAAKRWKENENCCDDISCVIVYLKRDY